MANRAPLEGIKVADFTWMGQGPLATKTLADWGATVVKIESRMRLDQHRAMGPMVQGLPGVDRSASFFRYNSSKYSFSLNLRSPRGAEVAKRLVRWADVAAENFLPATLEKWGLGYGELKKVKPDIILVRGSMQGQDGPYARHPGFGTHVMGLSGYGDLVGWADRFPVGISAPVTDFIGGWYFLLGILGALDFRRRTGQGQCIDMAQLEAGLTLLSAHILDFKLNQRMKRRTGNSHPENAPHGVYPCKGEDAWCGIAVSSEGEWESLCRAMGRPALAKDPRFATAALRKKNEAQLDAILEEWTARYSPEEVMQKLQGVKVPAGAVKNAREVCEDPQLTAREHFRSLRQGEAGIWPHETAGFRMRNHRLELGPAPSLGEHTGFVCRNFLGMQDEEFAQLKAEGVFE